MRTKKIEQAGLAAKQNPGMSSYTATNVLSRTKMNTPVNEAAIRGMTFSREGMKQVHKTTYGAIPYQCFEDAMVHVYGIVIVEEA